MIAIDIRGDLKPLQKAFVALGAKQVPFATSLALNMLAKGVAADAREDIAETFDTPTPFSQNAYRIEAATKLTPVAVVAAKDIQAAYLKPYVDGGVRSLGNKRAMLAPRKVGLNKYGNLTRNKLASLKGKPGVFIGPVTFKKSGRVINGVWQRSETKRGERYKGGGEYGTRGKNTNVIGGVRTTLTLLIEFEDTTPVSKTLDFYGRARANLKKNVAPAFDAAMNRALATARR